MKLKLFFAMAIGLPLCFMACEQDEKNARVQVWLTDAPGDFEAVNIDIQDVQINAGEGNDEKGWTSLEVNKGVYNLLELTNGLDTLLGEIEIPAGKISQIRLKLGSNNTVKVGGEIHNLTTPSAQQSGLKLQVHETFTEGITYKILLDFDVARSIIQTGSENFKLKPVIRTILEAQNGAIKGEINPKESTPAIYAIHENDTLGTTYGDSTGHFLLRGLPANSYKIVFDAGTEYKLVEKTDVSVTTGRVTDMGTIEIPEN